MGKKKYSRNGRYLSGRYNYALAENWEKISCNVDADIYDALIAFAYMRGDDGKYTGIIRYLLRRSVAAEIEQLDPADRKIFEETLPRVRAMRDYIRQSRRERMKKINAELRAIPQDASDQFIEGIEEDDILLFDDVGGIPPPDKEF